MQNVINILHLRIYGEIGLAIEPTKTEILVAKYNTDF